MQNNQEILTIEEVAKYLKLKPQTIYKWAQDGQIPGTKLGKEWRFRRSILDEWIDTSIYLSKSGFDLMLHSSMADIDKAKVSREHIDDILRMALE